MIRVLLVEDDPVIRDTTCYFLKSQQNFEVVCAETGGDALSHAREKFDVILMDILLPDSVHYRLHRHIAAKVDDLEAVVLEDDADDVLADVVDIALDGGEDDAALAGPGPAPLGDGSLDLFKGGLCGAGGL